MCYATIVLSRFDTKKGKAVSGNLLSCSHSSTGAVLDVCLYPSTAVRTRWHHCVTFRQGVLHVGLRELARFEVLHLLTVLSQLLTIDTSSDLGSLLHHSDVRSVVDVSEARALSLNTQHVAVKEDAEENIWIEERWSERRLEKTA
jgi:hypothetical protein